MGNQRDPAAKRNPSVLVGLLVTVAIVVLAIGGFKVADPSMTAVQMTDLLKLLVGPALVVFLVIAFLPQLRDLLPRITKAEFDPKSGKFSFEVAKEISVVLNKADEARRAADGGNGAATLPPSQSLSANDILTRIDRVTRDRFSRSHILWVDDQPENNANEMDALRPLGMKIDVARTTDEALAALGAGDVDLVISDLGRPGDGEAGFTLARAIRDRQLAVPVIVYTGYSRVTSARQHASANGVSVVTADPWELFDAVIAAILQVGNAPEKRG